MKLNLSPFPFENALEKEALFFLEKHAKPISMKKQNILFYQGDICDSVLLLTKGEVRLYIQDEGIESIDLYTLKAGEQCIVNTASTLSQTNAIATAESTTPIEGYIINANDIKKLSSISPVYQNYIFTLYTIRMADLTSLINDIKFKKLDIRILEWIKKHNKAIIKTTHEEIANTLGSNRVVISRTLKLLEKDKKVKLYRGSIELL